MLTKNTYIPKIYKELDQSLTVSLNIIPLFDSLLDKVFNSLNLKRNNRIKKKEFLKAALLNLKIGAGSKTYIAVHLNKNHYSIPQRYKKSFFAYSIVNDVIDELKAQGWIYTIKGSFDKAKKSGIPTRIRPLPKLEVELRKISLNDIIVEIPDELIHLRKDVGGHRFEINYKDTRLTKQMRADLLSYSQLRKQSIISLVNVPKKLFKAHWDELKHFVNTGIQNLTINKGLISYIPLRTTFLVRKFNDTFKKGGRFYCGIESNLSKHLRPYIYINNSPTVELDYSGMHVRMLYHIKQRQNRKDVYNVEPQNPQLRDIYKDVALISINSKINKAVKAIRLCLANKPTKKLLPNLNDATINGLISNFKNAHSPIKDKLFSGIGITLQNLDSMIANDILKHFTKKKVLCLCIHDSFIAPKGHRAELDRIMKRSYKKVMRYFPVIK